MDFGFNNIAPSRDPGPGPAPRKTGVADMGFADILSATLNASEDARHIQPSNTDTYAEATPEHVDPASPPPRETAPPAKHDTKESQPHKPDGTNAGQAEEPSASPVAEAPAHEPEESQAAPAEQSKPATQKTETPAETPQNVAAAAPAPSTPSAPAPVVVAQVAPVVVPENSATPQQGAPATTPAASTAPPATAQPAATDVPVVPQTQPVSDSAASAPDFETHLQAAAAQTANIAGESPAAPTQSMPAQSTPDKTAQAAPSAMPKVDPAASQNIHQEAAAPAQAPSPAPAPAPAPAPQTTAPAVPAAQVVAAQTSPNPVPADTTQAVKAPAADATPDVVADDGDAAPIIAFTRSQTTPRGGSTTQAAATDAARRAAANDATGAQPGKDAFDPARTTTTPEKTEAASRPLRPLAPATGLAAQATAQDAASGAAKPQVAASPETQVKADSDRTAAAANTGAEVPKIDLASANAKADAAMAAELHAIRTNAVDAPAAAARAGRALPHSVVAQIAPHIAQAAADGNDRINIRLSPADLGRVEVKLEFGPDGRVQAVFAADRPQTVDLLQRDARDLERALQDAGLRADSGSLSFNLRGENREQPQRFGEAPASKRADDLPAETAPQYHRPYASASAASGRLDIRV